MKKRLVCTLLVVLFLPFVFADTFEWAVYVQGGDFDQSGYLGQYGRGSETQTVSLPADAHLYHLDYASARRSGCSGDMTVTVEPGIYHRAAGLGSSDSSDFPYQNATSATFFIRGSDEKQNWYSGRTCHYTLNYHLNYAVKFYSEENFVNRRQQERSFGELSRYIPPGRQLQTGQVFKVHSQNPSVIMWFGTPDTTNQTTTTDQTLEIFACEDTDQNGACDWTQAEECRNDGGDWYGGRCCGVDRDTPACQVYSDFVQRDFAGNVIKNITFNKPAVCGLNIDGDPEWAYIQDVGGIHELTQCPNLNLVSDGTDYYHCGTDTSSTEFGQLQPQSFDYLDITFGTKTHQFTCYNNKITECPGDDLAMSAPPNDARNAALGDIIDTVDGPRYCLDGGSFTADLDNSPLACQNAQQLNSTDTEKWTGHYCCSEDLDTNDAGESYNDPFDPNAFYNVQNSSAGGCFDAQWIQSGSWLVDKKIINAQGVFYGCQVSDPAYTNAQDLHVGGQVIQAMNNCDKLDLGSIGRPEGRYAVCQPWGEITFTDESSPSTIRDIAWTPPTSDQTARAQGCCSDNQCWNGFECQARGTYYQVGDSGFSCN